MFIIRFERPMALLKHKFLLTDIFSNDKTQYSSIKLTLTVMYNIFASLMLTQNIKLRLLYFDLFFILIYFTIIKISRIFQNHHTHTVNIAN